MFGPLIVWMEAALLLASAGVASPLSHPEPGLTARLAEMALLKLPSSQKAGMQPIEIALRERLQLLPIISVDNPAAQLKLIFTTVKEGGASADLMASSARSVVMLAFPDSQITGWEQFRVDVALQSQLTDILIEKTEAVTDVDTFVAGLKGGAAKLKTDYELWSNSGDAARMIELRKRVAGFAAQNIANVWAGLLSVQPKPAGAGLSVEGSGRKAGVVLQDQTLPSSQAAQKNTPGSITGVAPGAFVGNKSSKKYHRSTCKMIPEATNQISIGDRAEAERLGYVPCKICKP